MTQFFKFCFILFLGCSTVTSAQDKKQQKEIKKLSEKACECTDDVSSALIKEEIIDKINFCITQAIVNEQMDESLKELKNIQKLLKETKWETRVENGDTVYVADKGSKSVILADKNFQEIQDYMMKNCKRMKTLIGSEDLASDKSYSSNPEAMKFYTEGNKYAEKGKNDKAIESYKKAVKADPEFAFAWDNLGLSYRKANNYEEAIKCYNKSLEVDPFGILPLQNLAVVYEYTKDYKAAAGTYSKLIESDSNNPEGYYGAGRAYYMAGDYEKGVDNMFKAFVIYTETRSPYASDAQNNLAFFYSDLKKQGKEKIFEDMAAKNKVDIK
ncbi:tetratricopeptide repeat protein [Flavobacterium suzhouense]|uniref:Tetratricopeptide repeat protein n=1 Tax=Flavobacterium suzhouense TaxID=1529638 RepID=A0ABW5NU71_9FLAO